MFGYITPCAPELKVRDKELYQAYYCGLCRAIGNYGNLSRVCLTYDGAFLAMLLQAICGGEEEPSFIRKGCAIHPARGKLPAVSSTPELDFAAAVCVMLAKHKLLDDVKDGRPARKAALPLINSGYKKAKQRYKSAHDAVIDGMASIADIELQGVGSIDAAPIAFSNMLRNIVLTYAPIGDSAVPMGELCRGIGGFIYVCDAWDDRDEDKKRGVYNIFNITGYGVDYAEAMLDMYMNAVVLSYDLLEPGVCKALLDNIVYEGLPHSARRVLYSNKKTLYGREKTTSNESI